MAGLMMPHVELDVVVQHIDGVPLSEMVLSRCVAVEQTRCGEYQDESDCFHKVSFLVDGIVFCWVIAAANRQIRLCPVLSRAL